VTGSRNRVLALIGALAIIPILALAVTYGVSESERQDIQLDSQAATSLLELGTTLSGAVRDQATAVDDYLLSGGADALARYQAAVSQEHATSQQMLGQLDGFHDVGTAIVGITTAAATWRATFAEPAITADGSGVAGATAPFTNSTVDDEAGTQAASAELFAQLTTVQTSIQQRTDALTLTRSAATFAGLLVLLVAAGLSLVFVWRYSRDLDRSQGELRTDAERSGVLNRFTEVTAFAADDTAVARSNLEALALLVHPDAAVTHVLNRSKDRAVPEATLGTPIAEILPLHALSSCPGIVRGSVYVTDDASRALSVHCPIYPRTSGTLACVPLAHGETVGSVHLAWDRPGAFPLELRASVARIAEHAALAIGNRRLLLALQGQANTDARTGLANSRALDQALEQELGGRREDESLAVLMLDLDHFKDFNDRHGHPAGDEALRAFAGILRSCLRDGDVAARYGGEEFAVMLPGVDVQAALAVAERIRSRTESSLISLAPGITDRISVSVGIAMAPVQGLERVSLLRVADDALYHAKQAGRNQVCYLGAVMADGDAQHDAPSGLAAAS
jgi:diguanylate cyclase (GGDEF)-like protein